ncbi:MAG TPA: glycosyltransferase [Bryobacteraceae bacterium]|nr:glycosyltransferase [Bryobacteraceae bacterium]
MIAAVFLGIAAVGTLSSTVTLAIALAGARRFRAQAAEQERRARALPSAELPPLSILKPLHGIEPRLERNLESFFNQDYPKFEVLFAVDHEDDAALPIARRVCDRHPEVPSRILITGEPPWPNPPAFSFAAMAEVARYDYLITSDSDVEVDREYLRALAPPLLDPQCGMVTCLYRGLNTGTFWSNMDAIGMSVEMSAGVLSANLLEGMKFGLGPTIAVRRDALNAIGGYEVLGDYFSNDFVIGNLIAARGYGVALSREIIAHVVPAMSFTRMWQRQLRWATGTRHSRPKGHFGTVFTYAVPWGIIGLIGGLLLHRPVLACALLVWSLANRVTEAVAIGWGVTRDRECLRRPWLYPVRDLLGFCVWVASYLSRRMRWRDGRFELVKGGRILVRDRQGSSVRMRA